LQNA
jgi:hypothetical protein